MKIKTNDVKQLQEITIQGALDGLDDNQVYNNSFFELSNPFFVKKKGVIGTSVGEFRFTTMLHNYFSLQHKIKTLEKETNGRMKGLDDRKAKLREMASNPLIATVMPSYIDFVSQDSVSISINSLMPMLISDAKSLDSVDFSTLSGTVLHAYAEGQSQKVDFDYNVSLLRFNKVQPTRMHTATVNTLLGFGIELVYLANMIEMFVGLDDTAAIEQFTTSSADMLAIIESFNIDHNKQQFADHLPTSFSDLLSSYGFSTNIPLVRSNVGKLSVGKFKGDITSYDLITIMLLTNLGVVSSRNDINLLNQEALLEVNGDYYLNVDSTLSIDRLLTTIRFLYSLRYARQRNILIKNFKSAVETNQEYFECEFDFVKLINRRAEGLIDDKISN